MRSRKRKLRRMLERGDEIMMTDPVKRWNPSGVYVWTDPETGVQYLIFTATNYQGVGISITPRLNQDGSLRVEGRRNEAEMEQETLFEIGNGDCKACWNEVLKK